jgi:hypothetical protein
VPGRTAEREHDRGGLVGENGVEQPRALRQAPGDEAAADPGVACTSPFPFDPAIVAVAATELAEPTGLADRGGEPAAGDEVHGGKQDRVLDAERAGFEALGSSSVAIAAAQGRQDGAHAVSRADSVANAALLAHLTGLPVSGDLAAPVRLADRTQTILRVGALQSLIDAEGQYFIIQLARYPEQ